MKTGLYLNIGQQLAMTTQLQQAIKLLQLSSLELNTQIQEMLVTNPLLEEPEDGLYTDSVALKWQGIRENKYHDSPLTIDHYPNPPQTLRDHLYWQCNVSHFSERDQLIAQVLIDSINEDGYLEESLIHLSESFSPDLEITDEEVANVLTRIQKFEPLGVGARSLEECLSLQLSVHTTPIASLATSIVTEHLALLGRKQYQKIINYMNITSQHFYEALSLITSLQPKPGSTFTTSSTEYIVPEIIVEKINYQWRAFLNPSCIPQLRLQKNHGSLLKCARNKQEAEFLKSQLGEAKWFLKSIENRNKTLLSVAETIVARQQDFFEYGQEAMTPMVLNDIAKQLDLHESTISRITTNKFLHSERGVFELKYFFSSHISHNGQEYSSTAIQAMIKKLIEQENPLKPMSDQQIVDHLKKIEIQIARRTVAKYRDTLAILPSHQRKKLPTNL